MFDKENSQFLDLDLLAYTDEPPPPSQHVSTYFGMDIGRHNDRTAITIMQSWGNKRHVAEVVTLKDTEYETQIQVLKELHAKWHFAGGYIDATGIGNPMAERISRTVNTRFQGFTFTASNKTPLHEQLRAQVFERRLTFATHLKKMIENDFRNISRVVTPNGDVRYQAGRTSSGHSDVTSSLLLALAACAKFKTSFGLPSPVEFSSRFA